MALKSQWLSRTSQPSRLGRVVIACAALGLFVLGGLGYGAAAQNGSASAIQAGADFSGVWQTRGFQRRVQPMDGTETPWLPWTKEAFDKREAAEKAGSPLYDPTAACLPSGVPRIIAAPYPIEIIHTPTKVVILHEVQHLFRIIHLDKKEHPKKLTPSFFGHSIGHWEGDTLVVDTIGLNDMTQIDEAGTQHSDALHVVERIRKVDANTLEDIFTIEDPKAFTKPWTARRLFSPKPGLRFMEYVCEENNRNAPNAQGELRKF
jgi:hypothetical protein